MSISTTDISRVIDGVPKGLLINGKQIQTESTLKVEDPSTGETLAEVADASPEDGMDALDAAVAAQSSWAATDPRERGEILRRAFELVVARGEDIALLMTLEMASRCPRPVRRSPTVLSSSVGSLRRRCGFRGGTQSHRVGAPGY